MCGEIALVNTSDSYGVKTRYVFTRSARSHVGLMELSPGSNAQLGLMWAPWSSVLVTTQ